MGNCCFRAGYAASPAMYEDYAPNITNAVTHPLSDTEEKSGCCKNKNGKKGQ